MFRWSSPATGRGRTTGRREPEPGPSPPPAEPSRACTLRSVDSPISLQTGWSILGRDTVAEVAKLEGAARGAGAKGTSAIWQLTVDNLIPALPAQSGLFRTALACRRLDLPCRALFDDSAHAEEHCTPTRTQIVRDVYRALASGDRQFTSGPWPPASRFPPRSMSDRIARATLIAAGQGAGQGRQFNFVRIVESGDEVIVTYEVTKVGGGRGRTPKSSPSPAQASRG